MTHFHKNLTVWAFFLTVFVATGCNRSPYSVVPVSGTLTVNGEPAPNWCVSFQPVGTGSLNIGPASGAITDAQGHFTLRTIEDSPRKGAMAGKFSISFCWNEPISKSDTEPSQAPFTLPGEATNGSLIFEVPEKGTKEANFTFTAKPRNQK